MSGQAVVVEPDRAIRFLLTVPVTRFGVGPFSIDPVEQLIGCPLAELLEPLRVGPIERRPSASGTAVEVHPMSLPEGEGLAIPLGQFGEVGLANRLGLLEVTVPRMWAPRLEASLGAAVVGGAKRLVAARGGAEVAAYRVELQPGMGVRASLGPLGHIEIASE